MREMKDSGVEWIGQIPKDWEKTKIKTVCSFVGSGTTPASNRIEYYDNGTIDWIQSGDIYGKNNIDEVKTKITTLALNSNTSLRIYKAPFIVMAMYGGSVGNTAISHIDACTNQACCCIKTNENANLSYMYYWLLLCKEDFLIRAEGGGQPNISQDKIKNQYFLVSNYAEQKKIADCLDEKCSEIDTLTSDIQKQIDTLEQYKKAVITETVTKGLNPDVEMKDSGVEWVGKIPNHWSIEKGKYILKYMQKPVKETDEIITCFRDGEVTLRSNRREDGFTISDKEIGYQGIDIGDLVVHGMDGFAGAIGVSDSRGKASPVLNVLDTENNKKYIMYYLRSMAYSNVFLAIATGIRVRSCDLRWNKLAELLYPVPPISEQNKIVEYIDNILQKADEIIADKKKQLEVITEYKRSLIYEYVTGKKEVM